MTGLGRILVAVDASPLSVAAAEAAVRVAARAGAAVEALFVEDINVVRVAAHPYVHTVSPWATRRESLDQALIDRALRLQAVAARRALERIAGEGGIRAGFAVHRGRVAAELIAAAARADLVCLGWSGRAEPGPRPRLGSVARAVAQGAGRPVMVLRRPVGEPELDRLLAGLGLADPVAGRSESVMVVDAAAFPPDGASCTVAVVR